MAEDLNSLHLADLHERAQRLGVPRFRLLDRDALIDAIGSAADDNGDSGSDADGERPARSRAPRKPWRARARGTRTRRRPGRRRPQGPGVP